MLDLISEDIKKAMKAREKIKLEALRYVKKLLIENKTSPKPKNEQDVVISYAKKLQDSLENFPPESELYQKTKAEIACLADYLPKPLSEEEVVEMIRTEINAMSSPAFGPLMGSLSQKIKGRFDGKRAAVLVKDILAK